MSKFSYLLSLLDGKAKKAIEGLPVTAQHYEDAKKILKRRFGRKELIIFCHIQVLLAMEAPPEQCKIGELQTFNDKLQSHIRCLAALQVDGQNYGVVLTPLILSRLPADVRMEWARDSE